MQFWPAKVVTLAAKSGTVEASAASSNTIIRSLAAELQVHPFQRLGTSGRDQPADQRVDPEVPIEDVAGPVRDFITGCWPTAWCATSWTDLTAPQ